MKVGDKMTKKKGYDFSGIIVAEFENLKGETRIVAEHIDSQTDTSSGMLHIFNPSQIEVKEEAFSDKIKKQARLWVVGYETPVKAIEELNKLVGCDNMSFEEGLAYLAIKEEIQRNLK